jgi:hypothetical protein
LATAWELAPLAAIAWLNLAPRCSRSWQFFTDANECGEALLEDDDEEEEEDDDDEADDDEEEVWLELDAGGAELFLLPHPAAASARLNTATATSARVISSALPLCESSDLNLLLGGDGGHF